MEIAVNRFTDSLPYLLNRVGVRMGDLFSRELAAHDLTLPMYRVLAALSERGDQRLTDLSAMTTVELTTLSRLVAVMQTRHLVSRQRPDDNLRTVRIALTATGRTLAGKLMPRARHYEDVAMRGLDAIGITALKANLATIFDNLGAIQAEQEEAKASALKGCGKSGDLRFAK